MKFSSSCAIIVTATVAACADAFTATSFHRPVRNSIVANRIPIATEISRSTTVPLRESKEEEGSEPAAEAKPEPEDIVTGDPYERIGITESEMAIGIDASEFLQWIGTKADLVAKFQRDNKTMDEEKANEEVSKFIMDAEMVNAYIKFEKDKVENPPNYREEAEQTLSDPKTIATYAAWLIGGASFGWVRNTIIEPKYASGEWEEIHIEIPSLWKPAEEVAASAVDSVAQAATDSVAQAIVDTSTQAM